MMQTFIYLFLIFHPMQKITLKNGLTIVQSLQDRETTAINLLVKVGSSNEEKNQFGFAHFIEHMLFEGTKSRTALEISKEIEGVGGEFGAYTTNERTCYYIKSLSRYYEKSLEILSDIISNPLFANDSLQKERGVILSEISMRKDEPRHYQWDLFITNLFKDYPLGHPIIGYKEIIKKVTREELVNFFSKYYIPNNMTLVIVGPKYLDKKIIGKHFGNLQKQEKKEFSFTYPLKQNQQNVIENRKINQTYIVFGYRTHNIKHEDTIALDVLQAILGRGMSGRLFDEIRNKRGLAYDLGCMFNPGINYGFFAFYYSCEKKNIKLCKELMLKEIKDLKNITDKELEESKNYLEGDFIMENEDNMKYADSIAFSEYANDLDYFKNYIKHIRQIKKEDVLRVAKKYITKDELQVFIGPKDK
jgi:predicted Zn-dependent peptidase